MKITQKEVETIKYQFYKHSTIGIAILFFVLIISIRPALAASSLQRYCGDFNDIWFMDMRYSFGYCNPPNFQDVEVTTAAASFFAHLEIGRVGELDESETSTDIDAKFSRDIYEGSAGVPLGTSRNEGIVSQSFYKTPLGNYATLSTYNRWGDIIDYNNNGKSLGQRQEVSIVYRIRQGVCYAKLSVRGEGPKDSKLYFGTLSDKAKIEAESITAKMGSISICAGNEPNTTPALLPPQQPTSLPKPTKQEVVDFTKKFAPDLPTANEDPIPTMEEAIENYKSNIAEEAKHITEMKKCPPPFLPSENECVKEKIEAILSPGSSCTLQVTFMPNATAGTASEPPKVSLSLGSSCTIQVLIQSNQERKGMGSVPRDILLPYNDLEIHTDVKTDIKSLPDMTWMLLPSGSGATPYLGTFVTDIGSNIVYLPLKNNTVEIKPASIVEVLPLKTKFEDFYAVIRAGGIEVKNENSAGGEIIIQTPLTVTRSNHTHFSVFYNSKEMSSATTIYEGEVAVTDILTGETIILTPTPDGKPRVLIVPLNSSSGSTWGIVALLFWVPWFLISFFVLRTFYANYKVAYVKALRLAALGINVLTLFLFFFPWIPNMGSTGWQMLLIGNYWVIAMFALLTVTACLFLASKPHILKAGAILQIIAGILFIIIMIDLMPKTYILTLRFVAPILASLLLLVNIVVVLVLWHQLQLKEKNRDSF